MVRKSPGRGTRAGGKPESAPAREDRIIDTTLALAASRGWANLSLADIAAANEMALAELYGVFPSKHAILAAFVRRLNATALSGAIEPEGSARDRLFALVMGRLDALGAHKRALKAILADLARDPASLCLAPGFLRSMTLMAEAAGLETAGLLGALRVKGVSLIYLATLRTWLADDSPDGAKTMAALDRALKRAEMWAHSIPGFTRRRPAAAS
ncbi:MAG: TetR family transcriptional regulator [Pseudomonadota bacterium]